MSDVKEDMEDELGLESGDEEQANGQMSEENDFDDINKRIKQIEEEAKKIREMQADVDKHFNNSSSTASGSPVVQPSMSIDDKMMADTRSVYVGNVDYSATPDQLEEHFRGCGAIERVTILTDKFSGHPKGLCSFTYHAFKFFFSFAYIQFTDAEGMQNAISLTDSLFLGRQIKVTCKRTNRPGISSTNRPPRGRGRARMIVKYIYPGRGGLRRPRRRGFAPY
uniref:RRM domain-containing protein n=1 Tax=Ditylenchus dipsaci TaxID=166011 RepID=A0A915EG30_9BILA